MKTPLTKRPRMPIALYFVLAQVVVVVTSILKLKAVTLIVGVQGIALYGIMTNLYQIGLHISLFGMHSSGVRSTAQVRDDRARLEERVSVYISMTAISTVVAATLPLLAWQIGLFNQLVKAPSLLALALSLSIVLSAIAAAQGTVFKGVGATRIVLLQIVAMTIFGTLLGIAGLLLIGLSGVVGFFIFQPLVGVLLSAILWRRVTSVQPRLSFCWLLAQKFRAIAKPLVLGGGVFLICSLSFEASILFGRWSLKHTGLIDELALLNASWVLVTMFYGFMQGVMSSWLYPMLTHATQKGGETVPRVVDTVVLLTSTLGAVFVMAIAPFSELILQIVYSEAFAVAAIDFNLAMIGMMAQLLAAPILYLLLSRGQDRSYLLYNLIVGAIFLGGITFSEVNCARDVIFFFVIANWVGVILLIAALNITGQFRMRPRTGLLGGMSLAGAMAAAYYGETGFVRSVAFTAAPVITLTIALVSIQKELHAIRRLKSPKSPS